MKPPIKNLIGGVEELHTREYLLKISARKMGCRERSKFGAEEQQELGFQLNNSCFWGEREREREREREEEDLPVKGTWGAQAPYGAAWGWSRHLVTWTRGG